MRTQTLFNTNRYHQSGPRADANSTTIACIALPENHSCLVGSRLLRFPSSLDALLSPSHPETVPFFRAETGEVMGHVGLTGRGDRWQGWKRARVLVTATERDLL